MTEQPVHGTAEQDECAVNTHVGERFDGGPTGRVIAQFVGPLEMELFVVKFTRAKALEFAEALTKKAHSIKICKHCEEVLFPDSLEKEGEWIDTAWGEARCYPHDNLTKKHEIEDDD